MKATIHWVSADHAIDGEVRIYDTLFDRENPNAVEDFLTAINPKSLEVLTNCKLEPALGNVEKQFRCQFERLGYFCADDETAPGKPVFNRTVALRGTPIRKSDAKVVKRQTYLHEYASGCRR